MKITLSVLFLTILLGWVASELVVDFEFSGVAPTCCPTPPPDCGDGICDSPREGCDDSRFPCRLDCDCGALCGDEICHKDEDCESCPGDCGACSVCGNAICETDGHPKEDCQTCNTDCGRCKICGDEICELDENCDRCPADCGACPSGIVQGQIVDVVTTEPIFQATVQLFVSGQPHAILTTDMNGYFIYMGVPAPYATFKITAEGYYDAWTQVQVLEGYTNRFVRAMSPILNPGEWRVILTWLDQPVDLDLTLFGPYDEEIYDNGVTNWEYQIKNESVPWAGYITGDDVNSLGPESILILKIPAENPDLEFWVHNYSGDRTNPSELLRNSTAVVWVFNQFGQQGEWNVPRDAPLSATWWHVFNIRGGRNIINFNQYFSGHAANCSYSYCPYAPK